jgi:hypothetical protein
LDKDAPIYCPVQRTGMIYSYAVLGGLHHHDARIWIFGTRDDDSSQRNETAAWIGRAAQCFKRDPAFQMLRV